jgi:hypothetical protein
MEGVLAGTAHLTPEAERRLARAEAQRRAAFRAEDRAALEARFAALIAVA